MSFDGGGIASAGIGGESGHSVGEGVERIVGGGVRRVIALRCWILKVGDPWKFLLFLPCLMPFLPLPEFARTFVCSPRQP